MTADDREVSTRDGRTLEVLEQGDPDGFPLLFHGGQPSAAVASAALDAAARDAGLRWVTYSRPGYGRSTVRSGAEAAVVVDDVADVEDLLGVLEIDRFVTLGWSGGGPRALACAAQLAPRCLAAATLAGVAPYDGDGLDWTAGMAEENVAEYAAAVEGRDAYAAHLSQEFLPVLEAGPDDLADAMGGLLPEVDRVALDRPFLEWLTELFHHAAAQGIAGVLDDGRALVTPWGFDPSAITVPVAVHHGRHDAMVPYAHGAWLAAHLPTAVPHLTEDDGHLTLVVKMPELLADLRALAGL